MVIFICMIKKSVIIQLPIYQRGRGYEVGWVF